MSSTISYKLPDLAILTRTFELRTNQNCRAVSVASEKWLSEPVNGTDILDASEREALGGGVETGLLLRLGLLASLCYPTCDAQQLRLATDFLGLLFCSNYQVIMLQRDALLQWVSESSHGQHGTKNASLAIANNVLFRR